MRKINLIIMAIFLFGLFATPILAYGGGGGGGSTFVGLPKALQTVYQDYNKIAVDYKESLYIGTLQANQLKILKLKRQKMSVREIEILNDVNRDTNTGVAVITTKTQAGDLYQQFDIISNIVKFKSAKIKFTIDKSWAREFDNIYVEHINDAGQISILTPTRLSDYDSVNYLYEVSIEHFSTFRILGEILDAQTPEVVIEAEPVVTEPIIDNSPEIIEEDSNSVLFVIVIITIILIIGYFLIRKQ